MRTFTGPMSSILATKTDLEPVIIVGIAWQGAELYYSNRDLFYAPGKIIQISELDNVLSNKTGQTSSITLTLDDTDGTIKTILDASDPYGRPATVYQTFNDDTLGFSDKFILFIGKINFDVSWSEGERSVTLTILNEIEEREVGFSPDEGQFNFVSPDAVGKAWPLCFGSPLHVPATRVHQSIRGTLNDILCQVDPALLYRRAVLQQGVFENIMVLSFYAEAVAASYNLQPRSANYIIDEYIDGLNDEQDLKVQISGLYTEINNLKKHIAAKKAGILPGNIVTDRVELAQAREEVQGLIEREWEPLQVRKAEWEENLPLLQQEIDIKKDLFQKQVEVARVITDLYKEYLQVIYEICKQQQCVKTEINIRDGRDFPQGTTVHVYIKELRFRGTFSGDVFTIQSVLPKYTNVPLGARQTVSACDFYDNEEALATFWVSDVSYQLKGNYALVRNSAGARHIIKITEQVGTQCTFTLVPLDTSSVAESFDEFTGASPSSTVRSTDIAVPFYRSPFGGSIPMGSIPGMVGAYTSIYDSRFFFRFNDLPTDINAQLLQKLGSIYAIDQHEYNFLLEMAALRTEDQRLYIVVIETFNPVDMFTITGPEILSIDEVAPTPLTGWLGQDIYIDEVPETSTWLAETGTAVIEATEQCEIYVANILPSTVKSVSAYRTIDEGSRSLTQLPASYYDIRAQSLSSLNLTTIYLKVPLKSIGEGWEDDIYVSLTSTVGPNVVDVIEFLIENYTDKATDSVTFSAVRAQLTNYPVHFALLNRKNALQQINEIAHQARCVVYEKNGIYYIQYLAKTPTPVDTVTTADVLEGTMEIAFSDTSEMATRLVGLWKPDYLPETEINRLTVRHNVLKYGDLLTEMDFYIYNIGELVEKSATFWLIRMCNSWKRLNFQAPMNLLHLEVYDAITLNTFTDVASGSVKAIIESAVYNSEENTISFSCWLPIRSGEMGTYTFAWPGSASATFPTSIDISSGYVGSGNPIITGSLGSC